MADPPPQPRSSHWGIWSPLGQGLLAVPLKDGVFMFTTVLTMLWIGGCGSPPAEPEVQLPEPWAALALPIQQGAVERVSDSEIHIVYLQTEDSRADVAGRYGQAITASGFEELNVRSLGPMIAVDYLKGAVGLRLLVASVGKRVDVELAVE